MSSPSSLHGVVAPDQLTLSRDAREASPTRRRAALPSLQGDEAPRSVRVVACEACRIAKVRCSQHRPTCRRCTKRRVECVYTGRRTPSPSPILESGEVSIERDGLGPVGRSSTVIPRKEINHLLDVFFTHVYPTLASAIVRRGELYAKVDQSSSSLLIKTICALSYRFSPTADSSNPDGGSAPARWAEEAKQTLMAGLNSFSTDKLATLLYLTQHEVNSGRHGSAWLLMAMAARMAFALRLHYPAEDLGWTAQESRRRLMWAVFSADKFGFAGLQEFTLCPIESLRIPLPASNHNFNLGIPVVNRTLSTIGLEPEPGADGILSRHVWLMYIRSEVLRYVKHLDAFPGKAWDNDSPFSACLAQLRRWKETLPPELELTTPNLYVWQGTHELGPFLTLHLFYDQIHGDLYRIAMPGFPESAPAGYFDGCPPGWPTKLRYACYVRACSIAERFKLVEDLFPELVMCEKTTSLFVYESIRNQLQYLFVAKDTEGPQTQTTTTAGFEAMLRAIGKMTKYYTDIGTVLRDLQRMLVRHNYPIEGVDIAAFTTSVSHSPVGGPVLSRMHWMRRHLRQGGFEQPRSDPFSCSNVDAIDPVANEPLVASPARADPLASSAYLQPAISPMPQPSDEALNPFGDITLPGFGSDENALDTLWETYNAQMEMPEISPFLGILQRWDAEAISGDPAPGAPGAPGF